MKSTYRIRDLAAVQILLLCCISAGIGQTGSILREYWAGISGATVASLTGNANFPNNPSATGYVTIFEGPMNFSDNYGTRIRGFVHPPVTGKYTFWIASDDNGELWLSTDDKQSRKRLIASVPGFTN